MKRQHRTSPTSAAPDLSPGSLAEPPQIVPRKYLSEAQTGGAGDLAVRVEHEGQFAFFPLFTENPDRARKQSLVIQQQVRVSGWAAACTRHVREFTLAVFWLPNPLTCTYASLFTALRPPKAAGNSGARRVRVAILEPEAPVRWGLVNWVNAVPSHRCILACADARSLLDAMTTTKPDLVLYDAPPCMPHSTDFEARLAAAFPKQIAYPFGIYSDSVHAWVCVTGVDGGYFYRRRRPEQMLDPIAGAWQAGSPGREAVEAQVRHHMQTLLGFGGVAADAFPTLTQREREVLLELRRGHTDKSLASQLGVSVWTVHTHMKSIFEKLGVHTRAEAVAKCFEK